MKMSGERIHPAMKRPRLSPLRYPGGKGGLYGRLRELIRLNSITKGTYIEPYAGGAGAAIGLLITGEVKSIHINDLDPAVFAFWTACVTRNVEFIAKLRTVPVSVDEWRRQREIYDLGRKADLFDLGFATFYLNRTNRSGVLNGGPIGGHDQSGPYKIDARFNRDTLSERMRLIGLYSSKISVTNDDGMAIINRYIDNTDAFIYADPPYFLKAGSLYMNSFKAEDHAALAACLNSAADARWVLTYDNVSQVAELYKDRRREEIGVHYSARNVTKAKEVMVYSDSLEVDRPTLFDLVEAVD
ncbi:DNA adenine methylase [Pseudonocardia sp. DSM 110487]|uniref:DNA adenine methylase n=1 Tax=Pseudonocardia sp. DSM 110487 TaxID=2865833 RepID=UPI001C6A25D4|nr:DNA adenine methylase [Pseudonocardia sp. DSM 110487]QYN35181.1 DNA adenine methylase [Pseudonocardia sp. DSM 110487]